MFTKYFTSEDLKELICQLTTISTQIGRLQSENENIKREIRNVQTAIDSQIRIELDSTQKRYIAMLEGKLVKFDDEVNGLKTEKQLHYGRLDHYFFNK